MQLGGNRPQARTHAARIVLARQRGHLASGLSRQVAEHNVTINGLLPGQFNTDRIESLIANSAKNEGRSQEEMRNILEQATPAKRLGEIEEFGFACAWMCSAYSGFLTGQNILMDGGKFNSTL
ncbi:MAG: SDR family oxidoreductase [Candidatus Puniceispirillum sp.]